MTRWRWGDRHSLLVLRIGAIVLAWIWWALRPSSAWVLVLAAVPVLINLAADRSLGPPFVAVCILGFLVTAVVALWATYDRDATRLVFDHPVGRQKLWGLALGALFFFALVTIRSDGGLRWTVGLLGGLGALVAVGFIGTNDWVDQPALWEPITRLGDAIQALFPSLPRGVLNPNIAGGIIAPMLPLSIGLAFEGRRVREPLWVGLGLLTCLAMALALILTTSRGAWLAIGGALALTALWWLVGRFVPAARPVSFAVAILLVAVVAALAWAAIPPLRRLILTSDPVVNRFAIFSQAALLVRDYPLTGSGLGTFPLIHSTYSLMIHVPVLSHAHALLLNVALEQGLIAADAMILVWAAAFWSGLRAATRHDRAHPLLSGALISLAVLVIHSLVDDALYSSRGILFLWTPLALVLAAARDAVPSPRSQSSSLPLRQSPKRSPQSSSEASTTVLSQLPQAVKRKRGRGTRGRLLVAVAVLTLVLLAFIVRRPLAAVFHANAGAVHQTLVELRAYDSKHFDRLTLDQIRRQRDLSAATHRFERALKLDPNQVTALTRVAQISLSRGDYDAALRYAQAAWDAGYRDRVTRLVLGDALVANGEVDQAAQTVQGLERAQTRLQGQAVARYQQAGDWRRAAYAWRTLLALEPGNDRIRAAAARAEERAAQP